MNKIARPNSAALDMIPNFTRRMLPRMPSEAFSAPHCRSGQLASDQTASRTTIGPGMKPTFRKASAVSCN